MMSGTKTVLFFFFLIRNFFTNSFTFSVFPVIIYSVLIRPESTGTFDSHPTPEFFFSSLRYILIFVCMCVCVCVLYNVLIDVGVRLYSRAILIYAVSEAWTRASCSVSRDTRWNKCFNKIRKRVPILESLKSNHLFI